MNLNPQPPDLTNTRKQIGTHIEIINKTGIFGWDLKTQVCRNTAAKWIISELQDTLKTEVEQEMLKQATEDEEQQQ